MSSRPDLKDFPDVEAKLQRQNKQSVFDKSKAEAEAKRKRDDAETQAALAAFEKSFEGGEDEDNATRRFDNDGTSNPFPRTAGPRGSGPGPSPRSFGTSGMRMGRGGLGLKTGPGSLGPVPGAFGDKKRSSNDFAQQQQHKDKKAQVGEESHGAMKISDAFNNASDDEDEVMDVHDRKRELAIAKPTLRLANMPPGISQSVVKALIPANLKVEGIKLESPPLQGTERNSAVAIVTLSQDTPVTDIEAAVSALQNEYLGYGYYLSLHRHLSSAVANSAALSSLSSSAASQPFGAIPFQSPRDQPGQQGFQKGFAPPSSYQSGPGINTSQLLYVHVRVPDDIRAIRLIHQTIEQIMEHGAPFEALLMSRPEVQKEKKWDWIWDARSEGGVYYRYKMWEIVTGSTGPPGEYVALFQDMPPWRRPDVLPFEFITEVSELTSDPDYDTSDNEDSEDEHREGQEPGKGKASFLNPLHKTKLVHLLARLPATHLKIRKGDVARVTTFALKHATRGVDEVVDMVVSNIERPYSLSGANPKKPAENKDANKPAEGDDTSTSEAPDVSAACLVGLYVIHDILSSSATNSMPRAWRYRQLFETALRERKVFEKLGLMHERLNWGRLRAEKWKRSVWLILNQWKANDLFSVESQTFFTATFENPPSAKPEVDEDVSATTKGKTTEKLPASDKMAEAITTTTKATHGEEQKGDVEGEPIADDDIEGEPIEEDDIDGQPIKDEDLEGQPIQDDEIDGEPINEDDIDGEPIEEDEIDGEPIAEEEIDGEPMVQDNPGPQTKNDDSNLMGRSQPRKRMRAVDMFASSDESDRA